MTDRQNIPYLCGGILFGLILPARKKNAGKQETDFPAAETVWLKQM